MDQELLSFVLFCYQLFFILDVSIVLSFDENFVSFTGVRVLLVSKVLIAPIF